MDEIKEKLSELVRDPTLEKLELQLKEPNIFYILKFEDAEIRHSNFLAWLLDPKQSHGLADLFLKRFLKDIFSLKRYDWIDEFEIDSLNLEDVEVIREWQAPGQKRREKRRIDILIGTARFVMCIENKITASESPNQLREYRNIIQEVFPDHNKAFVYLTLDGDKPLKEDDALIYQVYSYSDISRNLTEILDLYSQALADKTKDYINDYLLILKREIMKEDKANELAKKIYQTHKDAIDFVIDNKPDRSLEVSELFKNKIEESGWIMGSSNKGFVRFLTKELHDQIPRTGTYLTGREAFLFQVAYEGKSVRIQTVIAPGNENNRQILSQALQELEGVGRPRGKEWLTHFNKTLCRFEATDPKHTDDDIKQKLDEIWPEIEKLVSKVESKLLEVSENFDQAI
ncbi:MAG: PD-(D/E)XK nuclease family protein [Deltaproteobacteria bacterium]|nr:PD-(D/E)XK nuclease family protein [Deltaproteobacteria bacterium]